MSRLSSPLIAMSLLRACVSITLADCRLEAGGALTGVLPFTAHGTQHAARSTQHAARSTQHVVPPIHASGTGARAHTHTRAHTHAHTPTHARTHTHTHARTQVAKGGMPHLIVGVGRLQGLWVVRWKLVPVRYLPVRGPLPHIAYSVVQPILVGLVLVHRCRQLPAILRRVLRREEAVPC